MGFQALRSSRRLKVSRGQPDSTPRRMKGTEGKNYYELLGVERQASKEEIREAYREIARVYHPDSHFYDEILPQRMDSEAAAVFKIITAAYTTLSNDTKRAEYDRLLPQPLPEWDDGEEWGVMMAEKRATARPSNPARFGAFGSVSAAPMSAFDTESEEKESAPRSGLLATVLDLFRGAGRQSS